MIWPNDYINKIICGNCLEIMKDIPNESIDMIFADPPFNVGKNYGKGAKADRRNDYYDWCRSWINECFRLLKDSGTIYIKTLDRHLEQLFPIMMNYGKFINLVKWKNVSASHSKKQFWSSSEPILVYGKTDQYVFNTYAQTRENSKPSWNKKRRARERGQLLDWWDDITSVYSGSILHPEVILMGDGTRKKAHPCQSPIGLIERAILFSSLENNLILDPFMGIGTSIIASIKTNRNYIGIDISKKYCEIAEERLKNIEQMV